jgi:hypothetical protein
MANLPDGVYSYHFSGHSMAGAISHYIVGIGTMTLSNGEITGGRQESSLTRLVGSGSQLQNASFKLSGKYAEISNSANVWTAKIKFDQIDPETGSPQILIGDFSFVAAGPDKYWFISTGAEVVSGQNPYANEVVSGKAVRLG